MKNIRIEKIADMVRKGMIVADIGTDHAFLPVLLIRNKKCRKVYACDIGEGPLRAAEKTIAEAGMQDNIFPVLSDGFENVPEDANGCVIAGMGYLTAAAILEAAYPRLGKMKQILVEINRDTIQMRKWISDHNMRIDDEAYINDRGHDYVILSFTAKKAPSLTKRELFLGPVLMEQKDPAYIQYCAMRKKKIETILINSKGESDKADALAEELVVLNEFLSEVQ